ncbi:hypothetical protein E2C01_036450 [Portunus trituberculatus]|uniref:Uncharacterized protein n=1 Tax=Portunus trituberculatus TaxID=210409 RepID=A0A5B7FC36_PORTR|nr:hypothetical protein [Portunus trituberculatus]
MNMETGHGVVKGLTITQVVVVTYTHEFNPFNTGTHFYLEICVRLEHFIDIRKSLWRSED